MIDLLKLSFRQNLCRIHKIATGGGKVIKWCHVESS